MRGGASAILWVNLKSLETAPRAGRRHTSPRAHASLPRAPRRWADDARAAFQNSLSHRALHGWGGSLTLPAPASDRAESGRRFSGGAASVALHRRVQHFVARLS